MNTQDLEQRINKLNEILTAKFYSTPQATTT